MKTVVIEGQLRESMGRKATRDLRSHGFVPAVIYGGEQNLNFYAPLLSFRDIVYTPDFMITEIKVGDKSHSCILKDLQFDPVTDKLIHVDFQQLVEGRKVIANIPLKFEGLAQGVRDGGRFITKMKSLKVRTYPKYLVSHIEVDITDLKLHENVRVEDVQRDNLEIMNSPRQPICSVATTRTLRQAGTAAATEGEAAEGGEAANTDTAAQGEAAGTKG